MPQRAPTTLQLLQLEIDCELHQVWRELLGVISEDDLPVVAAALRVAFMLGRRTALTAKRIGVT